MAVGGDSHIIQGKIILCKLCEYASVSASIDPATKSRVDTGFACTSHPLFHGMISGAYIEY